MSNFTDNDWNLYTGNDGLQIQADDNDGNFPGEDGLAWLHVWNNQAVSGKCFKALEQVRVENPVEYSRVRNYAKFGELPEYLEEEYDY